jgi:hypothetical protein
MEDVRIFKIENIRFLCLTGYSESNGAGVQVSRCLWILVTYRNILNWISPPLSDLFPPPPLKSGISISFLFIHASDFPRDSHQLHESLLAQNGGILGGQPYRFPISFQKIYNYK